MLVAPGTSYVDVFRRGQTPTLRGIYADRIAPHMHDYPDTKEALSLKAVEDGADFALYDNFYTTVAYDTYKNCQIVPIPVEYFPVQFAYAFQKGSPYFEAFT